MSDDPRKPLLPPGQQRAVLLMAICGFSFVLVLAIIALLLRFLG